MTMDRNGRSHKGRGTAGAGQFDTMAGRRGPDITWGGEASLMDEMEDAAHAYTERVGRLGDDGLRIIVRDGLEVELHLDSDGGTLVEGYIFNDAAGDEDDFYREGTSRFDYYDEDDDWESAYGSDDGIVHQWDLTDYPDMGDFYRDVFDEAGEWPEDDRGTSWEKERVERQRDDDRSEGDPSEPRYETRRDMRTGVERLLASDARNPRHLA